ncbi:MAG TPA: glutaredoxin family protein [Candidatus Paceibacterota bacterium]|nr:glutaredoxin family protein [Candidatus Paceibacterota bacterium]
MQPVTIYSTPTCHYCHLAKEFFDAHHVAYTDYDVSIDAAKHNEMIALTGQLGVPVIRIGDTVLVGFKESTLKELLGI